ncbi:MAG: hypothetical protein Q7S95_02560 [bacterium]|nr:hypothetical protein [bacterium]
MAAQVAGEPYYKEPAKPAPLLSIVALTYLDALAGTPTNTCFIGPRWAYRDDGFDNRLPAFQPKADACVISTLAPSRDWTFPELATTVFGVDVGKDVRRLGHLLIGYGHTMTLPQAEEMVEATESGVKTGMRINGLGDFFFVETGDPEDPVSLGGVACGGPNWRACVYQLDGGSRWGTGVRLLLRDVDPSKLGL